MTSKMIKIIKTYYTSKIIKISKICKTSKMTKTSETPREKRFLAPESLKTGEEMNVSCDVRHERQVR